MTKAGIVPSRRQNATGAATGALRRAKKHAPCMVCGVEPAAALYRDPEGWYLTCCNSWECVRPPLTVPYTFVMSYEDFLACRRMIEQAHHDLKWGNIRMSRAAVVGLKFEDRL